MTEPEFEVLLSEYGRLDSRLEAAYKSIKTQLQDQQPTVTTTRKKDDDQYTELAARPKYKVGIVCGSGLGELTTKLKDSKVISYGQIDQWPTLRSLSVVLGHEAKGLVFGTLGNTKVVCQSGRLHFYEGYTIQDVVFTIRLFKLLGCQAVIVTNAAGAVNPTIPAGTILALHDHISLPTLTSFNPLIGPNSDLVGPRFTPMSDAYDFELRKSVFRAVSQTGINPEEVKEGTYAWVTGPTYETKAEGKFIRSLGADVVGMSTVPEVIAARHIGLRVLGLSLVTNVVVVTEIPSAAEAVRQESGAASKDINPSNIALDWKEETANHDDVLRMSRMKAENVFKIVNFVVNDSNW